MGGAAESSPTHLYQVTMLEHVSEEIDDSCDKRAAEEEAHLKVALNTVSSKVGASNIRRPIVGDAEFCM